MRHAISVFHILGTLVGAAVIVYGLVRFVVDGSVGPLLISIAIIVVGPIEDLLEGMARRHSDSEETQAAWIALIDRATSLVFLILLGATIALWP